jgi:hypothetical protein
MFTEGTNVTMHPFMSVGSTACVKGFCSSTKCINRLPINFHSFLDFELSMVLYQLR